MTSDAGISIRPYREDDAHALHEASLESVREVRPFLSWCRADLTLEDAHRWIEAQKPARETGTAFEFAITSSDGTFLGGCGVNQIDDVNRRANVGYWVRSSATRRGVATIAVRQLVRWAFTSTDLIRLELVISTSNAASLGVAEKAGATREGVLRKRLWLHEVPHDAVVLSFVRDRRRYRPTVGRGSEPTPSDSTLKSFTPPRATVFDEVASSYHDVRPDYPDTVFEEVIHTTSLLSGALILEVGCGTGKATAPLASRGFEMLCLEPGPNLAAAARTRLKDFPRVRILNTTFEQWPVERNDFDLVVSAQAFHWVDRAIRLPKAASILKPSGHIALIWNVPLISESSLGKDLDRAYRIHAPELIKTTPPAITELESDINAVGLFEELRMKRLSWSLTYESAQYVALLDTYSDHRLLPPAARTALFAEVASTIDRAGGAMTVPYETVLLTAQVKR